MKRRRKSVHSAYQTQMSATPQGRSSRIALGRHNDAERHSKLPQVHWILATIQMVLPRATNSLASLTLLRSVPPTVRLSTRIIGFMTKRDQCIVSHPPQLRNFLLHKNGQRRRFAPSSAGLRAARSAKYTSPPRSSTVGRDLLGQ